MNGNPYCKFCLTHCFKELPANTPPPILEAYREHQREWADCETGKAGRAATCDDGMAFEMLEIGYCWRDVLNAVAIIELAQAVQHFRVKHGANCDCAPCALGGAALMRARDRGVLYVEV